MACSDRDYEYLRGVVQTQSGNLIDPSRNALFETRLTPVARLAGASSLTALVSILRSAQPAHLHRAVAEAMTINETSFFRDVRPFEALRTKILPKLIGARAAQRRLRIWSAACSTGQEAYTLAIVIREHFPELANWDVKITGTDVSHQVVDYAGRGRYRRLEVNRGLPARMMMKYLKRDGEEWEISPEVRSLCSFRCMNLGEPMPKVPVYDLVLLRNVLLYFSQADRSRVLSEVHDRMTPDGWLLLGNAEQAEDSSSRFRVEFADESYFYRPAGKM